MEVNRVFLSYSSGMEYNKKPCNILTDLGNNEVWNYETGEVIIIL